MSGFADYSKEQELTERALVEYAKAKFNVDAEVVELNPVFVGSFHLWEISNLVGEALVFRDSTGKTRIALVPFGLGVVTGRPE